MPFSTKQQEYLDSATRRWNYKTGATRSGKTFLDFSTVIPKRIISAPDDGAIVLLGNTRGTLSRNVLDPMRQIWGAELVGPISSDNTVRLFGRKCYALGADKITSVSKIQGMGVSYAYGDEVTTWNEDVFTMLKSRLDKPGACFDGTCNPENPRHWVKKFLDSDADIYQQAYTIDDNPFLDPGFVENLKKEYSGTVYYDRYIKGLWVAAEGAIYRNFVDHPEQFIKFLPPPITYSVIGVDFGGGTSAHAFSCVGFLPQNKGIVILAEYYCKDALDPGRLEREFTDFVRACAPYRPHDAYCDSAEQTLINGLRVAVAKEHLPINVGQSLKRPINDRIRCACILQASGRFFIMNSCPHTIEAFQTAVWDSKKLTEDVRLDDGTNNQDSIDAVEYAYEREIGNLIENYGTGGEGSCSINFGRR